MRSELGTSLVLPVVEVWTTEGWTQIGKSARVAFAVRQPVVIQPEVLDASANLKRTSDSTTGAATPTESSKRRTAEQWQTTTTQRRARRLRTIPAR